MQFNDFKKQVAITHSGESVLETNKVLRNTYLLLGATLSFSAVCAMLAMAANVQMPSGFGGIILFLVGAYGLLFLTQALRNSVWGLVSCFAFTGFMGYTLGPLLNAYIANFHNGAEMIMTALGGTGLIFFGLSAYVLTTRKNFSFLSGFLTIGIFVLLIAMVANIFLKMPALQMVISACFTLFASAMILWQTSEIINGGERNYVMATISLFVSIYNLFISLLQLLSIFSGDRE